MINRMSLEKVHVSKVVKKPEGMGLVTIKPLSGDKRSTVLSPTGKGQNWVINVVVYLKSVIRNGLNNLMQKRYNKYSIV
jgi:DNA-binding MarR family transcriptional regulator